LAQARAKIAELERKIGQQALDIAFFHKALRALDAADRQSSIAPVSRKSSKSRLHLTSAKLTFNISASSPAFPGQVIIAASRPVPRVKPM
jgi:hypothetical protein